MLYFNNNDSGVQDCGNLNNYSQDSGNTVPAGALPGSGDDVTLNCDILTSSMGGLTCHDLYLNGFSIGPSSAGATAVVITSVASINGGGSGEKWNTTTAYDGSAPLVAVGVSFLTDPGVNISASSGCSYTFSTSTTAISDDGSGYFYGGQYLALTYAGTLDNTHVIDPTSFGNVAVTGSITTTNVGFAAGGWTATAGVSITAGSYGFTVATPAFSATIAAGTLTTTTFTGTQTGGVVTLTGASATYQPASRSGGTMTTDGTVVTIAYADPITGDSFTTAAPTYTPAQYVLSGQTSGGNPGSLTLPSTGAVLAPAAGGPASWGVGGTGSTGTYTPRGGVRQNGCDGGFNG